MAPAQAKPERVDPLAPHARIGDNPFVFVVGCPRSGTTLLQRLLDHHPSLAVANDTHFVTRCLERLAPRFLDSATAGEDVPLTTTLRDGVRDYRRFDRLGLATDQVERAARRASTYRDYVSLLYTAFAKRAGKPLGGEKTPDYVRHLPLLHGLFPWARSVHIVRDGRDVALSVLQWANEKKGPGKLDLWRTEPVATCALWWRWQVFSGRQAGSALGAERYLELSYDELVTETARVMRRVTEFLGLSYAPEMLAYHAGRIKSDRTLSAKSRWLPPTPGLRDWRKEMSERDVALFEALAGDLLTELGLERVCSTPSPAVRRVAASSTSWWESFLERRAAKALRRAARMERGK